MAAAYSAANKRGGKLCISPPPPLPAPININPFGHIIDEIIRGKTSSYASFQATFEKNKPKFVLPDFLCPHVGVGDLLSLAEIRKAPNFSLSSHN